MARHIFKPGEKESVAAILGLDPKDLPDVLSLEPDDEENEEDEEESDDDEEEQDEDADDDEDEEDDEDEDESLESESEALTLEWQEYRKQGGPLTFLEYIKSKK